MANVNRMAMVAALACTMGLENRPVNILSANNSITSAVLSVGDGYPSPFKGKRRSSYIIGSPGVKERKKKRKAQKKARKQSRK